MNRRRGGIALLAVASCLCAGWPGASSLSAALAAPAPRPPRLSPDYTGLVVPPNIAPLNFVIEEPGTRYRARLAGPAGAAIEVVGRSPAVVFPLKSWGALLRANVGHPLSLEVAVLGRDGEWQAFETVTNHVVADVVDGYLVYRRLRPLYNLYRTLGIYQRDLATFDEQPVLENRRFGHGCLNCHTFLNHQPEPMALHIRGAPDGNPMLLVQSNEVSQVAKTAGYLSWHPSGRLLVFSANKLSLFYHTTAETRDVFDANSDLGVYRVDSNTVVNPPVLARPDRLETWPAWAPDGRTLYFSSARKLGNMDRRRYRQVRYDLVRVAYDLDQDRWGEPETVVSAEVTGRSAVQPRVSPDGHFLVYGLCAYGHFPIYRPDSDLYLLDLRTGEHRPLDELNSEAADTWHCWSANSRWLVFSSKRRDGLFARPHFAWMNERGEFSKPFVLPQADPAYYDSCLQTFNVPELIRAPVAVSPDELARAATRPRRVLRPETLALSEASTAAPVREYEDAHAEQRASGAEDAREP